MSDSRRVYSAIKKTILQLYPTKPQGHLARHLATLAFMASGMVLAKSSQLPKIASKMTSDVRPDSREKQMSRWVQNAHITFAAYFLPFVQTIINTLAATRPLVLIMDGSVVARGCVTLMVSLVYAGRTLPLTWLVIEGTKGHFPTDTHLNLLREVKALIPDTAGVTLLGDGEFDSPELQAEANGYGWQYVCRTAKNICIQADSQELTLADLKVVRGSHEFRKRVTFTQAAYGPVMVIAWWDRRYTEPIYLVSNLNSFTAACQLYRQRMRIETFFSDQKSRGFQVDKSHLSDAERVSHLMIAACFAYLWVIYLGNVAHTDKWVSVIHRQDRCDLSRFQIGLRLLDYLLNHDKPIPVKFIFESDDLESVR